MAGEAGKVWPTLYKATATGAVAYWVVEVEPAPPGAPASATLRVTYGQLKGKAVAHEEVFERGKNVGRSNETTPLEQALKEAEARWVKQQGRKGYGLDPSGEESAAKRAALPMLAQVYEKHAAKVDWDRAFAQPKLDGFRCLATVGPGKAVVLRSREGKVLANLGHIAEALRAVPSLAKAAKYGAVTLDGELYHHDLKFGALASAIRKAGPDTPEVEYHVYDAVLGVPYAARMQQLDDWLFHAPRPLDLVVTQAIRTETGLIEFQQWALEQGYEGAMLRHGKAGYEAGKRSASLLKVKTFVDDEFVVTGGREGRGTHAGMAILACATAAGHPFEVLAPGTHADKKAVLAGLKAYVGRRLTVKYLELTDTEKPVPRFPVAVRWKEDL